MPVSVAKRIFSRSFIESFAIASRLPERTVLNGSTFFNSGFFATTAGTRSRQYTTWVYMGCSTQVVPSWSKVAMRASGGTNLGLALSVVTLTSSTMVFLAGPSFQDGSGSPDAGICASAEMEGSVTDKAGIAANPERTARRLTPEKANFVDTKSSL